MKIYRISYSTQELSNIISQWPKISEGAKISGLTVRHDIPNTGSIDASMTSHKSFGLREVPMSIFNISEGKELELAEQIKQSGEINPLIVAVDGHKDGIAYILEGSHRIDALKTLNVKSFPALVILDTSDSST